MSSLQKRLLSMIRCFRREWCLYSDSERITICGADCMLMVLQLAVAEVNKKHHGDFNASLSEVVLSWNYLLPDKLRILHKNEEAPENYAEISSVYTSFLKRCNMMDLIDIHQKCGSLLLENESLSSVQLLEFITGTVDLGSENNAIPSTPSTPSNRTNEFNEEMATSFIRTIELGGKGYAPSPDDPLRTHVKGLSHFIHFMDKLEEILGEVSDSRIAGGQILSTIKMHLIKGRNSRDLFCQAAEEVVQDLDLRIKNIINFQHEAMAANTTGISPARPKLHSINHGTTYCGRDTVKSLLALLDEAATHPPSKNKAQLLFSEEFGFPSSFILFRSPTQTKESSPKALRKRIQTAVREKELKLKQPLIRSQFACTYKDDQMTETKGCSFSTFQTAACIHSVPNRMGVQCLKNESTTAECLQSPLESAALGTGSGNVHQNGSKSEEIGKLTCQPRNKSSKKKQVDRTSENVIHANENESLQHILSKRPRTAKECQNSLDSKTKRERKCNKIVAKHKLIKGQTKLTQFFRL
ncbi:PCNA-interacting partner isoform X4 [Pogona vitticeps]